jgi:hypothetical protein
MRPFAGHYQQRMTQGYFLSIEKNDYNKNLIEVDSAGWKSPKSLQI